MTNLNLKMLSTDIKFITWWASEHVFLRKVAESVVPICVKLTLCLIQILRYARMSKFNEYILYII
jgi:hypothetical protein